MEGEPGLGKGGDGVCPSAGRRASGSPGLPWLLSDPEQGVSSERCHEFKGQAASGALGSRCLPEGTSTAARLRRGEAFGIRWKLSWTLCPGGWVWPLSRLP